jgi:hypothetical protein
MAPANARSQLKDHVRHVFGGIAVPAEIAFPEKLRKNTQWKNHAPAAESPGVGARRGRYLDARGVEP